MLIDDHDANDDDDDDNEDDDDDDENYQIMYDVMNTYNVM